MNLKKSLFRAALIAWLALPCLLPSLAAAQSEELLIFTAPNADSAIASAFENEHLPRLREAAEALDVPVRVVAVDEAAPPAVRITPLLVYQSHRGRAVFQGRYVDPKKLQHFLRTSRVVLPDGGGGARENLPVYRSGRSRVGAPIKVTALSGDLPADCDGCETFEQDAIEAIHDGLSYFRVADQLEIGPSDRLFYMDFYPHLSENGTLSVSLRLFSQFHCIDPVFERFDEPIHGPWEDRRRVFATAAAVLERAIREQLSGSEIGDGFDAVSSRVAEASWDDLGLSLPPAPEGASPEDFADVELPTRWTIAPRTPEDPPRLLFRFPPPLERYSGEVGEIGGELITGPDGVLDALNGWVEAATSSVTMGESTLDAEIHRKMLQIDSFPASRFTVESVVADRPLAFGRSSAVNVSGTFEMTGLKIPLQATGQFEPIIGTDGEPKLHVIARWTLGIAQPFGLEGPDGPEEAKNHLIFYLDTLFSGM